MRKIVIFWLCALVSPALAADEVPERYKGTWTLDKVASAANLAIWNGPDADKDRFSRELERMKQMSLTVTADQLIFEQGGRIDAEPVGVASVGDDALALEDRAGRGQFTLRLLDDEILLLEFGGQPPMAFSRAASAGTADASRSRTTAASSSSAALIAYMEALKTCTPGDYPAILPGFGEIQNTIEGRTGATCRVRTGRPGTILTCDYSEETIALLTSAQKVEDARNGVFRGSTDSEESRRVNEECRLE